MFLLIYPTYASPSSPRTLPLFGFFTKHFATKFWENILIRNFASGSLIWDILRPDLENSVPFVLQTFRHWTFCCRTFCCRTFRCRTFHCQIFCCLTFRCRICRTFRCWLFNFGYFVIVPFKPLFWILDVLIRIWIILIFFVNFRQSARILESLPVSFPNLQSLTSATFLERLPASFPNLQSLTLEACEMQDQTAQLEKLAGENPGLKIRVCWD